MQLVRRVEQRLRVKEAAVRAQQAAMQMSDLAEELQASKSVQESLLGAIVALTKQQRERDIQMETRMEELLRIADELRASVSANREGMDTLRAEMRPRNTVAPRSVQTADSQGHTLTSSAGGYAPPPSGKHTNPDDLPFLPIWQDF